MALRRHWQGLSPAFQFILRDQNCSTGDGPLYLVSDALRRADLFHRWRIKSFHSASERKSLRDIVAASITISHKEAFMGRGILLWLLGIPIPIIILIMLFVR
jgi:hypothetical protein